MNTAELTTIRFVAYGGDQPAGFEVAAVPDGLPWPGEGQWTDAQIADFAAGAQVTGDANAGRG